PIALKQGHEWDGKRLESLVELLQGALSIDHIAEAHLLIDLVENTVLAKMRRQQHDFSEPRRGCGNRFGRGLDTYRSISDTDHMCLLEERCLVCPSQRGTCLSLLATGHRSLRITWE